MDPLTLVAFVIVLIFSIVLHEVAHGYVAYRFGDDTAKNSGRLTLNPISHIDPFGTVILPGLLLMLGMPAFGWAKPVPINPYMLYPRKLGNICVALAGVTVNFILAISAAMILRFGYGILVGFGLFGSFVETLLMNTVVLNLVLGIFNLLPIPPLDGSRILTTWLPDRVAMEIERRWYLGILLVLILAQFLPIGRIIMAVTAFLVGT